ncbi:hypothetical protein, partial [Daejeonella sp.]|uniref:hypothetical protein n=1 Tax=Daejeonella sp. TaxID=2805397 RepID=UPI0030BA6374
MEGIPSIWRTELWHPMAAHFPIVTLLLSTAAGLLLIPLRRSQHAGFLKKMMMVMLVIGIITGWIGIYTGRLAYNIEVRKLCDPTVLQEHEQWGFITMYVYSAALLFQLFKRWEIKSRETLRE